MELKAYQQQVLDDLAEFIDVLLEHRISAQPSTISGRTKV